MKKICAVIMATTMLFLVSACNIKDVTRMASVGTESIGKGEFNFYLQQGKSLAMQAASKEGGTLSQTSTLQDWNTVKIGEQTAAEYAFDKAKEYAKKTLIMKAKAVSDGLTLTDEDYETIKTQRQQVVEQYGGRYNYEQYFTQGGFTLEDVESIITNEVLAQKVSTKYFGNGADQAGEITISDEQAQQSYKTDYVYVKHILVSNETAGAATASATPDASAAPDPDADAAAKAKAEDIIKKLDGGASFDTLMKDSDDKNAQTGALNSPEGYVFTKGEMVPEFETAAYALAEGKYTKEPVKTDYGYHVILRLPLPTSGDLYTKAIESAKSNAQSSSLDTMIEQWATEMNFKFNDKAIAKIKIVNEK